MHGTAIECRRCPLDDSFGDFLAVVEGDMKFRLTRVKVSPQSGLCNLCERFLRDAGRFFELRDLARREMRKLFERVRKEGHQYDAVVLLSGGKDSCAALILAKERYKLNVVAASVDNGFRIPEAAENIENLTDNLGVDLITFKIPRSLTKKLFRVCFEIGDPCGLCQTLVGPPIMARIQMKMGIPIRILGTDLAQVYHEFFMQLDYWRKKIGMENPFLFRLYSNDYKIYERRYEQYIDLLRREMLSEASTLYVRELERIYKDLRKYWLSPGELSEFSQENFVNVYLTAMEITDYSQQKKILERYGFQLSPVFGEHVSTDCKVAAVAQSLYTEKMWKALNSWKCRVGLISKHEVLNLMRNRRAPIPTIREFFEEIGVKNIRNVWQRAWLYQVFDKDILARIFM
ncbi:MAG: 7-cyano-7-deazaguanine synthase [Candidatus Baldrarchaeia archaeon]